jgi:hypothetical protein
LQALRTEIDVILSELGHDRPAWAQPSIKAAAKNQPDLDLEYGQTLTAPLAAAEFEPTISPEVCFDHEAPAPEAETLAAALEQPSSSLMVRLSTTEGEETSEEAKSAPDLVPACEAASDFTVDTSIAPAMTDEAAQTPDCAQPQASLTLEVAAGPEPRITAEAAPGWLPPHRDIDPGIVDRTNPAASAEPEPLPEATATGAVPRANVIDLDAARTATAALPSPRRRPRMLKRIAACILALLAAGLLFTFDREALGAVATFRPIFWSSSEDTGASFWSLLWRGTERVNPTLDETGRSASLFSFGAQVPRYREAWPAAH